MILNSSFMILFDQTSADSISYCNSNPVFLKLFEKYHGVEDIDRMIFEAYLAIKSSIAVLNRALLAVALKSSNTTGCYYTTIKP